VERTEGNTNRQTDCAVWMENVERTEGNTNRQTDCTVWMDCLCLCVCGVISGTVCVKWLQCFEIGICIFVYIYGLIHILMFCDALMDTCNVMYVRMCVYVCIYV